MIERIKGLIILLVVVLIGLFIFNRLPFEKFQQFKASSTDLSSETIGDYELGYRIDANKINKYVQGGAVDGGSLEYIYDNNKEEFNHIRIVRDIIGLAKRDGQEEVILGYIVSKKDILTNKKIGIGTSKEDVIKAYGKDYYELKFAEKNFIAYVDKDLDITLRFHLKDGIVKRYDLNYRLVDKEISL